MKNSEIHTKNVSATSEKANVVAVDGPGGGRKTKPLALNSFVESNEHHREAIQQLLKALIQQCIYSSRAG